jgi:hypothetical protein
VPSPAMAPYHIQPHEAAPLLKPVAAQLVELETRLGHYADRLRMTDETRATIRRAQEAVARARAEVAGHAG